MAGFVVALSANGSKMCAFNGDQVDRVQLQRWLVALLGGEVGHRPLEAPFPLL